MRSPTSLWLWRRKRQPTKGLVRARLLWCVAPDRSEHQWIFLCSWGGPFLPPSVESIQTVLGGGFPPGRDAACPPSRASSRAGRAIRPHPVARQEAWRRLRSRAVWSAARPGLIGQGQGAKRHLRALTGHFEFGKARAVGTAPHSAALKGPILGGFVAPPARRHSVSRLRSAARIGTTRPTPTAGTRRPRYRHPAPVVDQCRRSPS